MNNYCNTNSPTHFVCCVLLAQISALLLWLSHCCFVNTCRRVYIHKQQQGCHLCADRSLGLNCSVWHNCVTCFSSNKPLPLCPNITSHISTVFTFHFLHLNTCRLISKHTSVKLWRHAKKHLCAGGTAHGLEAQTVMCGRNRIPNKITGLKLNLKEEHCKHHIV